MAEPTQSINVPQILVLLVISALAIRWLFFSSPSASMPAASSSSSAQNNARNRSAVNPALVDQIAQMFPQLDRREIMWDLQRNGGNRQRTVERVLTGRGLETPPISFQPAIATASPASSARSSGTTVGQPRSAHPDLISRYNLHSKIGASEQSTGPTESAPAIAASAKQGWSANKSERQSLLQQRREQMILEARRKLEEKEKAGRV